MDKPADSPPVKSKWESIVVTTPVVLTVLGTLLAGLSSSEMTLAQYHRSLAAQSQSKAGDQWGLFQAKRIRGQNLEGGAELMPVLSSTGKLEPAMVRDTANRLVQQLQRGQKSAERLQETVGKAENGLGPAGGPLRSALSALVATSGRDTARAEAVIAKLSQELDRPPVMVAFQYLRTGKLPPVKDQVVAHPSIEKAVAGVENRQPESDLAPVLREIKEEDLQQAIDTAEINARAFEAVGKPVNAALEGVGRLLQAEIEQAAAFHQAYLQVELALADVPEAGSKALTDLQTAARNLARSDLAVKAAAEDLNTTFKSARADYNARRYHQDARYNYRGALLYEVRVHMDGVASDRHRSRSQHFFYGMLCAQAGVAIASMALAARLKSILWSLAGLAGLTALLFSSYVYLRM